MKLSNKEKNKKFPYQYADTLELGPWTSTTFIRDPMHLLFVLARYKFVAKLFAHKNNVLEIGCGDAIGLPLVASQVGHVDAIDIDEKILAHDKKRLKFLKNVNFSYQDLRVDKLKGNYDGIFSIDVIEHIEPHTTDDFLLNSINALQNEGVYIIGTPNITSASYASEASTKFHINLLDHTKLYDILAKYFYNVFIFSMNDEIVHTGYYPMAHYLFGVGVGKRT